jgi:hypothetical protein
MLKTISMIVILSLLLPAIGYARGYHMGRMPSYRSHGGIHWVRPYVTRKGSYHTPHLSANPRSGLHCRNNICGVKTW